MKRKSRSLATHHLFRYLIIGGSVYLFEIFIISYGQYLGARPVVAVGMSFCLGTILSFLLQKFVTFGDTRMHNKVLLSQLTATIILVVWNLMFTLAVTKLLSGHIPTVASRTIALAMTTCWNFYLYKTRIFLPDDNPVY